MPRDWIKSSLCESRIDIVARAERMRMAKQVVRKKARAGGTVDTKKGLLDWLKFAKAKQAA